jgi:hypothetical protein
MELVGILVIPIGCHIKMHYSNYDRNIHDIYLYGAGNSGYPIGINSNSLIAGASADFPSLQRRQRLFNIPIRGIFEDPITIPPGATEGVYPNYYNSNIPMSVVISEKIVMLPSHYTANKPSDSGPYGVIGNPGYYTKYTGTTTAYPLTNLDLWNQTLNGICSYGPFSGFYNFLPSSLLPSGYSFSVPFYFTGSPEIPGFENGNTFYMILNWDASFANLLEVSQNINLDPIKIISIYEVLTDEQKENLQNYVVSFFDLSTGDELINYVVPVNDVYMWDGSDKILPVEKIKFAFLFKNNSELTGGNFQIQTFADALFDELCGWATGDSSSQILCLRNNKLYFIGSVYEAGGTRDWTQTERADRGVPFKVYFRFALYQNAIFPNLQGLQNLPLDRNHYSTTLNTGLTLATEIDFTRVKSKMDNIVAGLNTLWNTINS